MRDTIYLHTLVSHDTNLHMFLQERMHDTLAMTLYLHMQERMHNAILHARCDGPGLELLTLVLLEVWHTREA
jgi:hypothetical protein